MTDARGFTLLEVLVALAILSVAVVASIQGFAQGLRLLKLAGDHQKAVVLADQKAREIVTPKEGREQGEDERSGTPFTWETVTTPIEAPDLTPTGGGVTNWRVWRIDVHVRWGDTRQVDLATIRTAEISPETTQPASPGAAGATTPGTTATGTASRPTTTTPATTPPAGARPPSVR